MTDMVRDEPPGVLARVGLLASGDRGWPDSRRPLTMVTLRRPVLYRARPEDVAVAPSTEEARLVGLVCSVELEKLPRGQDYGSLELMVSLPAGCRVVAFPDRPADTPGLSAHRFSQSVDRPREGTFATHAVVEVPHGTVDMTGELSCQVQIRRSIGRVVHVVSAVMEKTVTFTERVPEGGRAVRLVVSADMAAYSGRDPGGSERAQERLAKVSERARLATGVAVDGRQYGGDSFLFVFPPGVDESEVLQAFYAELSAGLREVNLDLNADARVRLRVGADRGLTVRGGTGWTGQAPITATRLADCPAARQALTASNADCVFVVSECLYRDVFSERGLALSAESFTSCDVHIPEKNFTTKAWLLVGGS
ncbi:hypothetical protein [Actinophytocola sp.]|uniref:hypothetical protein n=1 Tax=Actinophytocola sp. TaxID=1872138 RepID=UPI002ED076C5